MSHNAHLAMMHNLTFYIPHLLHAKNSTAVLAHETFARLLGKATDTTHQILSFDAQLMQLWHWPQPQLPAARLIAENDGLTLAAPYLYLADPVFLQADFSGVFLSEIHPHLSTAENEELVASLNAFLASSDMCLHVTASGRWLLASSAPIETLPGSPYPYLGKELTAINALRHGGQSLVTELQMLLHQHPVNQHRQKTGASPANSLWLWGAGELPAAYTSPFQCVYGTQDLLASIAAYCHVDNLGVHDVQSLVSQLPAGGQALIVLDDFLLGRHLGESAALEALLAHWLLPLESLLKQSVDQVTFHFGDGVQWLLRRAHLWRFWRKPYRGTLCES